MLVLTKNDNGDSIAYRLFGTSSAMSKLREFYYSLDVILQFAAVAIALMTTLSIDAFVGLPLTTVVMMAFIVSLYLTRVRVPKFSRPTSKNVINDVWHLRRRYEEALAKSVPLPIFEITGQAITRCTQDMLTSLCAFDRLEASFSNGSQAQALTAKYLQEAKDVVATIEKAVTEIEELTVISQYDLRFTTELDAPKLAHLVALTECSEYMQSLKDSYKTLEQPNQLV